MSAVSSGGYVPSRANDEGWAERRRMLLRRVLMIGGVAVFAVIAGAIYLWGGRYIGSDDSYVHANKLMVSTDVSGLVATVNVKEGQKVKAGDVLFTLDPKPFQIALDNARAAVASVVQDVESTRAQYRATLAQIAAQQAQVIANQKTLDRYEALTRENAIAPMQVDAARAALLSSQATVASLRQTAATTLAKLNGDINTPAQRTPAYKKAQAAVDEAQRQLDHTVVKAPFDGIVSEVDALQPGTLVISAMSAFTTTSAVGLIGDKTWIEADMKETDLTHVHPGAPVDIKIDTYPGCNWSGHIDTLSAGSDSSFSALPAENASGNWVKVVQRIPVRIAIDRSTCDVPLRSGMSTVISIDTGKRRWQRLLDQ
ncbi:MAG: HlyD family secretion protein [Alphaproteobacteria bacterium]|nr:HlyD family secretion protein [Alphaproteobacteria bacterium]